jgi:hypothetical protein
MKDDPYDCGYEPDKFYMIYLGREDGWYVIRVFTRHHRGLDACMMDRDLFEWLFEEVGPDRYHMLKSSKTKDAGFPKLRLCEDIDGHNTDILLNRFADVIAFDQHFGLASIARLMEGK